MKVKIFFNFNYKKSCNLVSLEIRGCYFNLTNDDLLIDNIKICDKKYINSIEFINAGYKNIVEVNPGASIYTMDLECSKTINLDDVKKFIKEIETC